MIEGERFIYHVNAKYFVYAVHCMNIVHCINIKSYKFIQSIFYIIYFQSLITDNHLINLLI